VSKHFAAPREIDFGQPIEFRLVAEAGEDPDRITSEAQTKILAGQETDRKQLKLDGKVDTLTPKV
jgi:hypothetical protein